MRRMAMWLVTTLGAAMAAPSSQAAPEVRAQAEAMPREAAAPTAAGLRKDSTLSIADYAIQPPGQFHAGETIALDGERWLALRMDMAEAALRPATVRVATVEDVLLDEPGERSGQAVSSRPADDAILVFLRGPALVAGLVAQARVDMVDGDDRYRFERALAFRDASYRLRSECTPRGGAPVAGQRQFDCVVVLRDVDSPREQVLVRMDGYAAGPGEHAWLGDDAAPELLFAGDLDHDGELDLLFDTSHHYNLSRPTLFLSSQAGPGELLREVATHEATGC